MAKSKTVQVVMPEALVEEVDEFVRRLNVTGLGGPTRSSVMRHMLTLALPLMREMLAKSQSDPGGAAAPSVGKADHDV